MCLNAFPLYPLRYRRKSISQTLISQSHPNLFVISIHLQSNRGPFNRFQDLGATDEPTSSQHQNIQDLARNEKQSPSARLNCIQGPDRLVTDVQDADWTPEHACRRAAISGQRLQKIATGPAQYQTENQKNPSYWDGRFSHTTLRIPPPPFPS